MDDLDGDRPAGRLVGRPEHHPHRPRAQDLLEAEGTELFADEPLTHARNQNLVARLEPLDTAPGGSIREPERRPACEHEPAMSRAEAFGATRVSPGASRTRGHPPRAGSCGGRSPSPSDRR